MTRASDRRELFVETKPRTITPREHDEGHSRWSNTSLFAVQVSAAVRPEERLYGLGQHTAGTLNQRNQSLPFLPMNTEVFIPFVISSHGYGYLLNYPGAGNLAWSDTAAEWNLAAATQFDLWVTTTAAGAEGVWPPDLMSHYADATGHAPVLPEWATGLWQSKNRYQTQQQLLDVVQGYRSRNLTISVIVADYFTWSPEFTTGDYDFDSTCWPSVGQMMAQLREWKVELMISTYGNFVSPDSKHYAAAVASGNLFATLPNPGQCSGTASRTRACTTSTPHRLVLTSGQTSKSNTSTRMESRCSGKIAMSGAATLAVTAPPRSTHLPVQRKVWAVHILLCWPKPFLTGSRAAESQTASSWAARRGLDHKGLAQRCGVATLVPLGKTSR